MPFSGVALIQACHYIGLVAIGTRRRLAFQEMMDLWHLLIMWVVLVMKPSQLSVYCERLEVGLCYKLATKKDQTPQVRSKSSSV